MAENMENQVQPGAQGTPSPTPSGSGTQAPSAVSGDVLAAIMERLDRMERGQQSTKDKRIAKLLEKQDAFDEKLARLQELTKQGVSQDDALWRIKVEDALAAKLAGEDEGNVGQGKQAGTPQPTPSADTEAILKLMGLDPASAEVGAILRETGDFAGQMAKFAALAQAKVQAPKAAPQSQQMPGSGGSPVHEETIDDIDKQLAAMRAIPHYQLDTKKYDELLQKRRQLSLPK